MTELETVRYIVRESASGFEVFDTIEDKVPSEYDSGLISEAAHTVADYYNSRRCPRCPSEPMKPRRNRCPICNEWISYIPDHPGHQLPRVGSNGRVRWVKPVFTVGTMAFLGHMNNHNAETIVDVLYEPVG